MQNATSYDELLDRATQAVLDQAPQDLPPDELISATKRTMEQAQQFSSVTVTPVGQRKTGRWSIAALVVAASLLAIIVPSFFTSGNLLAQALEKARQQLWVHAITTTHSGNQVIESETWFSPAQRIAAIRHPQLTEFRDMASGVASKYDSKTNRIVKTRVDTSSQEMPSAGSFIAALMNESTAVTMFPSYKVSKPSTTKTVVDGHDVVEHSFRLQHVTMPNVSRRVVVRLDAESGLMSSWEETFSDGSRSLTKFEYPSSGPVDIHAMDIPRDAEVVDRIASSDITKIADNLRTGRTSFDDYDMIFVEYVEGQDFSPTQSHGLNVRRVRRHGNQYRVDGLLRAEPGIASPAAGTDMQKWWIEHRDDFYSVPMLICNGKTYTTYSMVDGRLPKDEAPKLEVEMQMANPVSGVPTDPTAVWSHLMPEYHSRPHLWTEFATNRFIFDAVPNDGPAGSVRVIVRRNDDLAGVQPTTYWCDPEHDFCVVKTIQPVISRESGKPELAYIDTEEFSEYAQSPGGHWYPQKTRRSVSANKSVQIRQYYLDFEVKFADDLFQPLNLSQQ